ncbi:MAG TPA: hypothetical protein VFP84_27625 [Kofleriaceae bacterium]|nr:hypothetical protein [Kofleriaceae bacterium]
MSRFGRALGFTLLVLGAGCKQGEGERCQVDDDCASGLICNQAQQLCTAPGKSGGIDATVPLPMDAPTVDAPTPTDTKPTDAPAIDAP